MNGKYSKYTNPSKFMDHEDRQLKFNTEVADACLRGNHQREILKGRRIINDERHLSWELNNAFRL